MTRCKTIWMGLIAFAAIGFVGANATAAPATASKRDRAIQECIALAKAQNPGLVQSGSAADPGSAAMIAYKSCMAKKGLRP
jgi:hypothetical protein